MSIAKNTVTNMAEDLTYLVGYSQVNSFFNDALSELVPPELDENGRPMPNIALEVLSGGVSMLFTSAMMEVIRREEKYIEYLFAGGEAVISVLYLRNKGYFDGMLRRVKALKGFAALQKSKILQSNSDNQNTFVSQVYQAMQTILQGRNASHDVANTISASNSQIDTAINRENQNLKFAELKNKSFHDSLMLKFATGTFTEFDKLMLQKVIGRENFQSVPLDINEMNMINEFMFVKDSSGKMTGLSKAFVGLLNAYGTLK